MTTKTIAPYGFWESPIKPDSLGTLSPRMGEPKFWGNTVICSQSIAHESGRMAIVGWNESAIDVILPAPWDARSKVHEYGGGAYAACGEWIYFVNASDQNIYGFRPGTDQSPILICGDENDRYADLQINDGRWLFAVRERFSKSPLEGTEPTASIVAIDTLAAIDNLASVDNQVTSVKQLEIDEPNTHSNSKTNGPVDPITVSQHADFYAGLALSPTGNELAFICWQHPNMPWDETKLCILQWQTDSPVNAVETTHYHKKGVSVLQPGYSPDGILHFVADQNGWWLLYSLQNIDHPLIEIEAEFATPQWTFGMKNWGFLDDTKILVSFTRRGVWQLGLIHLNKSAPSSNPELQRMDTNYLVFSHIACAHKLNGKSTKRTFGNTQAALLAASHDKPVELVRFVDSAIPTNTASATSPASSTQNRVPQPEFIEFPTSEGETAYLWLHQPHSREYEAPANALPPLIVLGHGGPTGAADPSYSAKIQFWTTRGFAVADVNYRGSTGFGRQYRDALKFHWGIKDVQDLANAATYLSDRGYVHPNQKFVKGSSAGGFTVLSALTDTRVFNGGVSLYGVADLHALAQDTHKFEKHYLDSLICDYRESPQTYTDRSPLHKANNIHCPIFIAQGLEDKVVPPSQAQMIVDAAKKAGIVVTYLCFEGEGHGFRQASTLNTLFESELIFYQDIIRQTPNQKNII